MRLIRKLRFIFIALLTFLFVINVAFLRKTVALLLCGVLSFNLASYYSFLNQGEIANAATPRSRTPVTAGKNASPSSNPKYQFQLVAKAEMVVDGQALVDPGATANSFNGNRLIDDKGHIVYSDRGRIFIDDKAVAFKGKQIGNFVINEVGNYFLFKNGTLDILADAFDNQNKRNSTILIRGGKPLATFANSSISPQIYPECMLNQNGQGCNANAYYLYAYYKNYFRFDADGFKEVSIQEAEKRIKSSSVAFQPKTKDRYQCIKNNRNQVICSLTNPSHLIVRDDGKVFPSTCCDYQLNNNGKILTFNELEVFDYDKDAMPANTKFSKKDLEKAAESYGLRVPYDTLLGIPKNVDWKYLKHNRAIISDNGDIAIIVQEQLGNPYADKNKTFFASAIIRATPAGTAAKGCINSKYKQDITTNQGQCAPKIYDIFIGGAMDSKNENVKSYVDSTLPSRTANNPNIINLYSGFNDYAQVDTDITKAIAEKKKVPGTTINVFGHSLGGDTALTEVSELKSVDNANMIDNLILIDPVSIVKFASTKKENYQKARLIVSGRIIDINAQNHGGSGDTIAGLGRAYDDVLKNEAGITYIEDKDASHAYFTKMLEDKFNELGSSIVIEDPITYQRTTKIQPKSVEQLLFSAYLLEEYK